jgi:hypothetical protein
MATTKDSSALGLVDAIDLDFANLLGVLGVCRIAAAAQAAGDAGGYILRDADLPDALDGARAMVESLKERVEDLGDFARAARDGCVPDTETPR